MRVTEMASDHDDLLLADDDPPPAPRQTPRPWLVLVVDDDPSVHTVTRLVLRDFTFLGRPIACLSAFSAWEGELVLRETPDISVVLLDVVMETDDAGLRLVRTIREVLANLAVRIILRTGQPGLATEEQVAAKYDINEYRSKTDMSFDRLQRCLTSALGSYPGGGGSPESAAA